MKLSELNPVFLDSGGDGFRNADGTPMLKRTGVYVMFDCPCGNCGDERKLCIPFANPIDGGPPIEPGKGWQRTGEAFDTLTLTPSILRMEECKWHGFITNGEIITV